MSDAETIAATFRALGVESPEPWMRLPEVADDMRRRARSFQARYTGLRAALDGVMGDELHTRLLTLAAQFRDMAWRVDAAIEAGEVESRFGRGRASAYRNAADLLELQLTVRFDGDTIRGAWDDTKKEERRQ